MRLPTDDDLLSHGVQDQGSRVTPSCDIEPRRSQNVVNHTHECILTLNREICHRQTKDASAVA